MKTQEPELHPSDRSASLSLNKITILMTVGALGFLSWHFSGSNAEMDHVSETPAAIENQEQASFDSASSEEGSLTAKFPKNRPVEFRSPPAAASLRLDDEEQKAATEAVETAAVEAPKRVNRPPLLLTGVIRIGEGDDRALIRRLQSGKGGIWVSKGQEFQGWSLRELDLDSATIEANGDRVELRLY
jgi:hypothetical protein